MPTSTPQGIRTIRRLIYGLIAAYISVAIGIAGCIAFTIHQTQQICGLVNAIDDPSAPPPTNERQQHFAEELRKYRESIGCKEK